MGSVPKDKKLIRAPEELVAKLSEAASWQGKSFYRFISEILEQAVRSNEMKRSLKEIIDRYELMEVHREAGSTFTPGDALDFLVGCARDVDNDSLQRMWNETGRWYGMFLRERFEDPFEAFVRLLGDGLWGVKDVDVRPDGGNIALRCVSTMMPQERTILMERFIEGAMHSLGYVTVDKDSFRGIIALKFSDSDD